ncbi:MAG: YbbC/YhhH family protein [Puniceicoccales bacterium]|jgi:hypothetical protein|nr:YbbC/YhhH family protein [Puniceicoccales bacterium]
MLATLPVFITGCVADVLGISSAHDMKMLREVLDADMRAQTEQLKKQNQLIQEQNELLRDIIYQMLSKSSATAISDNKRDIEFPIQDARAAIQFGFNNVANKYGDIQIKEQLPLKSELKDGIWTVRGAIDPNKVGGVLEIKFSAVDGKIISVTHGR